MSGNQEKINDVLRKKTFLTFDFAVKLELSILGNRKREMPTQCSSTMWADTLFLWRGEILALKKTLFSIRIVHKVGKKCKGGSVTIPHKHGI